MLADMELDDEEHFDALYQPKFSFFDTLNRHQKKTAVVSVVLVIAMGGWLISIPGDELEVKVWILRKSAGIVVLAEITNDGWGDVSEINITISVIDTEDQRVVNFSHEISSLNGCGMHLKSCVRDSDFQLICSSCDHYEFYTYEIEIDFLDGDDSKQRADWTCSEDDLDSDVPFGSQILKLKWKRGETRSDGICTGH